MTQETTATAATETPATPSAVAQPGADGSTQRGQRARAAAIAAKEMGLAMVGAAPEPKTAAPTTGDAAFSPAQAPVGAAPTTEAAPDAVKAPEQPAAPEAEPQKADAKPEPDAEEAAKAAKAKSAEDLEKLEKQFREARRLKAQRKEQKRLFEEEQRAWREQRAAEEREKAADAELKARDPSAWLAKHQFDFREVAENAVKSQTRTPEQVALDEAKSELARERAEREALATRIEAMERQHRDQEQARALAAVREETASAFRSSAGDYPTLATYYSEAEVSEAATQLRLDHYRNTRREVPIEDVLTFMETNAKRERERFIRQQAESGRATDGASAPKPGGESPRAERGPAANSAKPRAVSGPAISNRDSATRASPQAPLNPSERRSRAAALAAEHMRRSI